MYNLPILIVTFRRLNGVDSILSLLHEFKIKKVFIAIDGAKNSDDVKTQTEMINIINRYRKIGMTIEVKHNNRNLGIGKNVISAIDWFFTEVYAGIVLEDDLLFDEDFLRFMNIYIPQIRENKKIMMVTGTNIDLESNINLPFLSNYPMIWGWGTNREKWIEIRKSIFQITKISSKILFDKSMQYFFVGSRRVQEGKIDTWDIPLAYAFLENKKYCVVPPVNLISNIGFDMHSSHTYEDKYPLNLRRQMLKKQKCRIQELKYSEQYDNLLESKVYKVKRIHLLSLLKYKCLDWFFFPKSKRLEPLSKRIS